MIVVDTSVLMALFLAEDEAVMFGQAIFDAGRAIVAAPTAFEFMMAASSRAGQAIARGLPSSPDIALSRSGVEIVPWTERHVAIARDAFLLYGKGQGHPAQLKFGDCMSYALAKALDAPLLYKGGDFALTDVRPAIRSGPAAPG